LSNELVQTEDVTSVTPTAETEKPVADATQTGDAAAKATDAGEAEPGKKTDEDAKDDKPKPKSRAQERIEELSRRDRNNRRTIARLNQELGKLKAENPPSEEDYANPADYQRDTFKRATREASLESQFSGVRSEIDALEAEKVQAWQDVAEEARGAMPDFDQVVFNPALPINTVMRDLLLEAAEPARLAYYLGKNPRDAHRISQMPPMEAARELGRLEMRVAPPAVKRMSSAPKPVQTVSAKAGGASARDLGDLAKADDATAFVQEMRRREAAKGA